MESYRWFQRVQPQLGVLRGVSGDAGNWACVVVAEWDCDSVEDVSAWEEEGDGA